MASGHHRRLSLWRHLLPRNVVIVAVRPATGCLDHCCCCPSLCQLPRSSSWSWSHRSVCADTGGVASRGRGQLRHSVHACWRWALSSHHGCCGCIAPCVLRLRLLSLSSWWWWLGRSMRAALGSSPSYHSADGGCAAGCMCWHWGRGHRCCHAVACVRAGAGVVAIPLVGGHALKR